MEYLLYAKTPYQALYIDHLLITHFKEGDNRVSDFSEKLLRKGNGRAGI